MQSIQMSRKCEAVDSRIHLKSDHASSDSWFHVQHEPKGASALVMFAPALLHMLNEFHLNETFLLMRVFCLLDNIRHN